ncbi:hypothetical protein EW026_g1105 [Hermanssonia centrifuga]|uniref:Serine/threonine specific protein phosphatases domain-containing protein n=1 Tax=Hermanssonia centrifuga TaxID=98765 RepID=A0A4S4KSK7_9APHY|nr:hypothetical protein EW026_g1105 [Hermanssonia centrifuga]
MSYYPSADDGRLGRTPNPASIYQFDTQQSKPQPRANTPERIRERQVKSVPPPYAHTPPDELFYLQDPSTGVLKPNVELLKDHFLHEGRLTEPQAMFILEQTTALMRTEPNMLHVASPVTVVGDIHGQYYDLMKVLEVGGKFSENNYLFLGDYVDRGCFGIEALPVTALIDSKFFCVHGGISPDLVYLSDLDKLDRFTEPASSGLLCDLLWADPIHNYGHETDINEKNPRGTRPPPFLPNDTRGCSYYFTYEAVSEFLERNKLLGIFRGHEAQDHGAPNYLDVYHNKGAVIKFRDKSITIRQYNATSHPYWLPNFVDAFTWSLPFVASKILEMLLGVLNVCSEEELEASDDEDAFSNRGGGPEGIVPPELVAERRSDIKNKILAVGKMQRLYQLLREEAENASELIADAAMPPMAGTPPGAWPGGFAPPDGVPDELGVGVHHLRRQIRSFDDARHADLFNERLPQFSPPPISIEAAPSMWVPRLAAENDGQGGGTHVAMESLIRRALEEEGVDDTDGVAERLAERIARTKGGSLRPRGLRRFDTT